MLDLSTRKLTSPIVFTIAELVRLFAHSRCVAAAPHFSQSYFFDFVSRLGGRKEKQRTGLTFKCERCPVQLFAKVVNAFSYPLKKEEGKSQLKLRWSVSHLALSVSASGLKERRP